jgi:50S ribosomal protein L16 3-hydroxylase
MTINNFDIEQFLAEYWQQKPLLIRNAFPHFDNPLSPDELAGLACEGAIESRIITEHNQQWQLENGPFDEERFSSLPKQAWTLLVQAVDHWVPEVGQLLEHFRFIPNWRIDDVMVSYASTGGSVGPHYDNYDVFLLQGAGSRRWQVGPKYDSTSELQTPSQLKILKHFDVSDEWILQAGDMLYLPPLYGHWGTATDDDCMTFSIGFRAPSYSELLSDFCDHSICELNEEYRYSDAALTQQIHPGELTEQSIDTIQQALVAQLADKTKIRQWLGRYLSQPKYTLDTADTDHSKLLDDELRQQLENFTTLFRNPSSKIVFITDSSQTQLFVDGCSYACDKKLAQLLANNIAIPTKRLIPLLQRSESFNLVKTLIEQESLYFNDDDYG